MNRNVTPVYMMAKAPRVACTPRLNYLCAGYRRYFDHVAPYMDYMKAEILAGRPPSSVMTRGFWTKKRAAPSAQPVF